MATKVIVPLLGEGVEEVTIVNWLKNEGDTIEEYEGLVEVETDKVVTEIPSPVCGTVLRIQFPEEGATAPVGEILAWVGAPGDSLQDQDSDTNKHEEKNLVLEKVRENDLKLQKPQPIPIDHKVSSPHPVTGSMDRDLSFISPVVRKIAAEKNIDLSQINGTGLNGRITKKDVVRFIDDGPQGRIIKSKTPQVVIENLPGTVLPLTTVRKRIADHMVMSVQTSPHVTTLMEADFSRVAEHRSKNKDNFAQQGVRLTYTAYIIDAIIEGLKKYPLVNSSWLDNGVLIHNEINIGMATDLGDDGLIVPVIKEAGDLSILGLARTINDLADRARSKNLTPNDVKDATFSITNHGVSGSLLATPIINQPQCAILGVGTIQKRVKVITDDQKNDSIAVRPMAYLTLTFDHRILDGAGADRFLTVVVNTLENW